jgi:transcriptional regulator with XRE-family HTH domain
MATESDRLLGMRLRELRERRSLTQAELASLLGVSTSLVAHWESGRRAVSIVQVAQIAKALGIAPGAFADRHAAARLSFNH